MNADELRILYAAFSGEARFEKFVRQVFRDLQTGHDLRHWQQQDWNAFREAHPEATTDPDTIRAAFAWCFVHHQPFESRDLGLDFPQETSDIFRETAEREFPFCYGTRVCPNCLAARDEWIDSHPFEKTEKPTIEWDELEGCLFQISRDEIRQFAAAHPQESFYGFVFDCNSDYGGVMLCLNTENELRERAKYYLSEHRDWYESKSLEEVIESLRWSTGDWTYQGLNQGRDSSEFESRWEPFAEAVQSCCCEEDEDPATFMSPTQNRFMESMCRVAIRLESSGAFDSLNRAPNFKIFVSDHDEPDEEAWARLDAVRRQSNVA